MAAPHHSQEIAMLRITLIGAQRSGKTTMANVFVNNIYYGGSYEPTEHLTLYHKYIHRPAKFLGKTGVESEPDTFILLEIEDTYGCDREKTREHDLHCKDTIYNPWYPLNQGELETAMQRNQSEVKAGQKDASKDQRKDFKELDGRRNLSAPLGLCELSSQEHRPLTKNRMAYFFVFDANSKESLIAAQKEYSEQKNYLVRKRIFMPIISYAVATQLDRHTQEQESVLQDAQDWADQAGLAFLKTSAAKREGIDELFETACERIYGSTGLWVFLGGADQRGDDNDGKKQGENCCIH